MVLDDEYIEYYLSVRVWLVSECMRVKKEVNANVCVNESNSLLPFAKVGAYTVQSIMMSLQCQRWEEAFLHIQTTPCTYGLAPAISVA